jgi:hypothetical protein
VSPSHSKAPEGLKRQAWTPSRAWRRLTRGVWLHGMGAVPYGTSRVCSKMVPHVAAQACRQDIQHVMAIFGHTGIEVVRVADRSGIQRAGKLASTLEHDHGTLQRHCFPAPCGPHLHPLDGCWRARKDAMGAGRCVRDLPLLSQRTRQVLMAHPQRPL